MQKFNRISLISAVRYNQSGVTIPGQTKQYQKPLNSTDFLRGPYGADKYGTLIETTHGKSSMTIQNFYVIQVSNRGEQLNKWRVQRMLQDLVMYA